MIPFLDLARRVESIRADLGFDRVLASGQFILGSTVAELEHAFSQACGVEYGVAVGSGTDAICLALEGLGIGAGDEVITAANTCAPTVAAILRAGALAVLADIDDRTMTLDLERVEAALGPKTRAVVAVHLYGRCAAVLELEALCRARGILLVEDCAQAHGASANGRPAGSVGAAGCYSFYPTKNLGGLGDGGMVVTRDENLARRIKLMRNYGYHQPNVASVRGYNSRMDDLQASAVLAGLPRLPVWNKRRADIARHYSTQFSGLPLGLPQDAAGRVWHLYVVRHPSREAFRERLLGRGVETAVHYPVPVHLQPGYSALCRVGPGGAARAERACAEVVSLPLYPEMTEAEIATVAQAVKDNA